MPNRDPFDNFDKLFDNAFNRTKRTGLLAVGGVLLLNLIIFLVVVGVIVGAILFLKAHGVF